MTDNGNKRDIPHTNEIGTFLHCAMCVDVIRSGALPEGESPGTWARLNVGWTKQGLQVWCARHDVNVFHVDFDGVKMYASDLVEVPETWTEAPPLMGVTTRFIRRLVVDEEHGTHELWLCWRLGRWLAFVDRLDVAERVPSPIEGEPPTTWVDTNWSAWLAQGGEA